PTSARLLLRPLPACPAGEAVWQARGGTASFWVAPTASADGESPLRAAHLAGQPASPAGQAGRGRRGRGTLFDRAARLAGQTASPAGQAGRGRALGAALLAGQTPSPAVPGGRDRERRLAARSYPRPRLAGG